MTEYLKGILYGNFNTAYPSTYLIGVMLDTQMRAHSWGDDFAGPEPTRRKSVR